MFEINKVEIDTKKWKGFNLDKDKALCDRGTLCIKDIEELKKKFYKKLNLYHI